MEKTRKKKKSGGGRGGHGQQKNGCHSLMVQGGAKKVDRGGEDNGQDFKGGGTNPGANKRGEMKKKTQHPGV